MEWARDHCLISHHVYLALSPSPKVGVTRHHQVPIRFIDQGANQALIIATTPNRYLAGLIEVELKKVMNDKTNWRNMLCTAKAEDIDLMDLKEKVVKHIGIDLQEFILSEAEVLNFEYPVASYPSKVSSLSFDKTFEITGVLTGIKGQYLYFDCSKVLNVRKHSGYKIVFSSF